MMDLYDLVGSVEEDFVNLLSQDYSKGMFISNAIVMLGEDWQTTGKEIVESHGTADTKKKFKEYCK